MLEVWRKNISDNVEIVNMNAGPSLALIVSGNDGDRRYWQQHFEHTSHDVFMRSGEVTVISVCEEVAKGNFLGTLNAWNSLRALQADSPQLPDTALISMVFGKGKRLSPFTQALGNRKAAFSTPLRVTNSDGYLNTADISTLYSNNWLYHLRSNGFRGFLVKWGDEAVIPGVLLSRESRDFTNVDAIRFVWQTPVTEGLAREKEWFILDKETGHVRFQLTRQRNDSLLERIRGFDEQRYTVGVNLGSIALTYQFLEVASEVMDGDIRDPRLAADWDPYVWLALFCRDEGQWREEKEHETRIGKSGILLLEQRYPDFYAKMFRLRAALERRVGRPLRVGTINFGEAFWVDIGLHTSLRRCFSLLASDCAEGRASREMFGIPHERDNRGNIIVRSFVNEASDIRDSVIVDSILLDDSSVIRDGVVVAGRHRALHMPHGGIALSCAVDDLTFDGQHGVAFRSLGRKVTIPAGGRHTTILFPEGPAHMLSNESLIDYEGECYTRPILGNPLSFKEAGEIMSMVDGQRLESLWHNAWKSWLTA